MVSLGFLAIYLPVYVCPEPTEFREIKSLKGARRKKNPEGHMRAGILMYH